MRRNFSLTKETGARLNRLRNPESFLPKLGKSKDDRNGAELQMQNLWRRKKAGDKPADIAKLPAVDQAVKKSIPQKRMTTLKPPFILRRTVNTKEALDRRSQIHTVAYTPLTAPPLKSIYLRWRKYKNCSALLNSDRIRRFFLPYGPIERVIFCSHNSAVVVFKLVRSACIAGIYANKLFANYDLNATWLLEYL